LQTGKFIFWLNTKFNKLLRKNSANNPFSYYLPEQKKSPLLNIILFIITIITTILAGAMLENKNPFANPKDLIAGLPFSITLLLILGSHEMGHYLFAKKHKVNVSLPYFIPAPTIIGTFGALIKMRSPIRDKKALIEIGAAGPIFGFLVAIPAYIIGLKFSQILPSENLQGGVVLGDSLLTKLLTILIYPEIPIGSELYISSIGFAAWIGFLVTMLNLLPVGQLDGGHILYAVTGKFHKTLGYIVLAGISILGVVLSLTGNPSYNWIIWALLVFVFIKVKHPPIYNSHIPIPTKHIFICFISLIIFVVTFIPVPFKF